MAIKLENENVRDEPAKQPTSGTIIPSPVQTTSVPVGTSRPGMLRPDDPDGPPKPVTPTPPPPSSTPKPNTSVTEVESSDTYTSIREQLVKNMENPTLPDKAKQTASLLEDKPGEILNSEEFKQNPTEAYTAAQMQLTKIEQARQAELTQSGSVSNATASAYAAAKAEFAVVEQAVRGQVTQLANGVKANSVNAQAAYQDLNKVDPKTLATALTHEVPNSATVKGQLDELLAGLETGDVPLWAQPAVTQAESQMAERGLSSSSVGRNALFNSIISAAMPIAQADAAAKLSVFQQDISNEQQAILANSQFFQTLTLKNLDNKQQAAIINATNATNANIASAQNMTQASISNANAFLQMDLANLNNEQQSLIINGQIRQQTLLSNQAAENTALQFNAANEQQAKQFNANLATSIDQFNATQENTASQFNSQLAFNREQFNVQNATAIEQANAQWRRQMNLTNTASINAVNQANAMNQFNLSNQALTFLWQEQRDAASWANSNNQNDEERKTRLAIAALSNESMADSTTMNNIKALAGAAIDIFENWGN